jgi:hypothetical protein
MKNAEIINEIRAKFIIESMNNGLNFESALNKSFNQINNFLEKLTDDKEFNELVFINVMKQV